MRFVQYIIVIAIFLFSTPALSESVWDREVSVSGEAVPITVYRSPTCGCCGKWLEHMKKHNFAVTDIKTNDVQLVKQKHGINKDLASCHTALVDGYVIEGHVPAADVHRLLTEKPDVVGLTVPAMPVGTPGMDMGAEREPFTVYSIDKNGNKAIFKEYLFY